MPPDLPPHTVWRRQVSPTIGPFVFSVQRVDYDDLFREVHPEATGFATQTKYELSDGDEFAVMQSNGVAIKLTVGSVIEPGGNP